MENEIVEISQIETIQAINRSEIDMQISTAKQYPRDLASVLKNIREYATIDAETAADCFYALKRGQGDDASLIEGLSVRMAEIFASSWGNLRVQTRIIGNDGKTITAQGICHDLETNVAVSVEVKRRITNKYGKTFSEDMQVVTGNAASAIAFRNAVFKVIPKALTKKIVEEIKKASLPPISDMESKREKTIKWFTDRGVKVEEILKYIESDRIEDIGIEQLLTLRSTANAINEGTTTIEETFHQRETIEEMKKEMRNKTDKQGELNLP